MSKKSNKRKALGARKGRPRQEGDRYPSGRLKPASIKNAVVLERRKELCDDITKATNPLDAALANGWISEADHRAATMYAALYRQTMSGGPSAPTAMDLSTPTSVVDYRSVEFRDMTTREVSAIWDAAMSKPGAVVDGVEDLERHQKATAAMERWKAVNAAMPAAVAEELFRVSVTESWPQWINHRVIAKTKAGKISAQKREPTEAEKAEIARFANSRFEASRDLLLEGCRAVRLAGRRMKAGIESVPMAKRAMPAHLVDATHFVDTEGTPLLTIERRSRHRPPAN